MLQSSFSISGKAVGGQMAPYVIAEAGSNFNQSLDTAFRMIDAAADSGADAVKFQLFRADQLYPNGGEMHEIFKSIELNSEWVPKLDQHARARGIHFLASAFDKASVDVLESIDTVAHKIASSETANLAFLHYVASKGRPMIISTGMCDMVDVEEAVNICVGSGNDRIILLQCGAMYPLPVEMTNLRVISAFLGRFACPAGFSDHTLGQTAATVAIGLGATVFEKHFTLDRSAKGPDHFYSLEPNELTNYVTALREGFHALGGGMKEMLIEERELGRREGLYAAKNLHAGERLKIDDICIRRPAIGLRARYASSIAGASLNKDLQKDDPITWDSIAF